MSTTALLLLPHLRVQNANAIPGPLSWGFPAPTAFTGFAHALERKLREPWGLSFGGVGILCHRFEAQVFQPPGRRNQVFRLTRNPVFAGYKKFEDKVAAIVEEARAHLEVSLVIQVMGPRLPPDDEHDLLTTTLPSLVPAMRLAGGSLLPDDGQHPPQWIPWPRNEVEHPKAFRQLSRRLLPGYALVQRQDLLEQRLTQLRDQTDGQADALDALLDLSRLNFDPPGPDADNWSIRTRPGWLVPIPVGYGALSPLYPPGSVRNSRDADTPFRFVESIYSLGAWVSPHRMTQLSQLLWEQDTDPEAGLYRCRNHFSSTLVASIS